MELYTFIDFTWALMIFGALTGFLISVLLDWIW